MFDLISIGTISADLYFSADELTKKEDRLYLAIGGKYRSEEFSMSVGGGAANTAIGARKQGLKTAVMGLVGNNVFRKGILQRLEAGKVNTSHIMFNQTAVSVSVILLNKNGERTVIAHQSSHEHVLEELHTIKHMPMARAVYFGNLSHVTVKERNGLMKKLRERGTQIFVNIGPADCCKPRDYTNELLEHVNVLMLNTHEFADLIKTEVNKINFRITQLDRLPILKNKILIVTDGDNGSYGYEGDNVWHCPITRKQKVVDTTGVGDAYTAGFIASYLKHEDVLRAMKTGTRYAAKIVTKIGAN